MCALTQCAGRDPLARQRQQCPRKPRRRSSANADETARAPEDVASTALFLVRDAPYITGQVFNVDGGRSIA